MLNNTLKKWIVSPLVMSTLVILVVTAVVLRFYARPGVPYTHDGENHLARFANYKLAVKEGQWPPRFAPNLANRYGYPVFNYNYPLANMVSLPFSFLKVPYTLTFKVLMAGSFILGLVGIAAWLREQDFEWQAVWFSMAVFGLNPYLTSAILYRGSIGEVMAMCLLPWLFWWIDRAHHTPRLRATFLTILGAGWWAAFFLSHNVTVLIGTPLVIGYALLKRWPAQTWKTAVSGLGLGLALSLWFWWPALAEKSAVVLDKANLSVQFSDHFVTWHQLWFSALKFGYDFVGSIDSLSLQIGVLPGAVLLLGLATSLVIVSQRKRAVGAARDWWPIITTLVIGGLCVLQLKIAAPVWYLVPLLRFVQFPWRLMLLVMVVIPWLGAQLYQRFTTVGQQSLWLLVILQAAVILHLKPVDFINKTNLDYDNFPQTTSTLNENLPADYTYGLNAVWQPGPVFLRGEGESQIEKWTGSEHQYRLVVKTDATIVEPTMSFLGWETALQPENEAHANLNFTSYVNDQEIGGRIAYRVTPGTYQVVSRFTQHTPARQGGLLISLLTFFALAGWGLKESWGILTTKRQLRTALEK